MSAEVVRHAKALDPDLDTVGRPTMSTGAFTMTLPSGSSTRPTPNIRPGAGLGSGSSGFVEREALEIAKHNRQSEHFRQPGDLVVHDVGSLAVDDELIGWLDLWDRIAGRVESLQELPIGEPGTVLPPKSDSMCRATDGVFTNAMPSTPFPL